MLQVARVLVSFNWPGQRRRQDPAVVDVRLAEMLENPLVMLLHA